MHFFYIYFHTVHLFSCWFFTQIFHVIFNACNLFPRSIFLCDLFILMSFLHNSFAWFFLQNSILYTWYFFYRRYIHIYIWFFLLLIYFNVIYLHTFRLFSHVIFFFLHTIYIACDVFVYTCLLFTCANSGLNMLKSTFYIFYMWNVFCSMTAGQNLIFY